MAEAEIPTSSKTMVASIACMSHANKTSLADSSRQLINPQMLQKGSHMCKLWRSQCSMPQMEQEEMATSHMEMEASPIRIKMSRWIHESRSRETSEAINLMQTILKEGTINIIIIKSEQDQMPYILLWRRPLQLPIIITKSSML